MEINREQIKETLLRILDHISDLSYQKRVWIDGLGPEVDDFDETICHFFQEAEGILEKSEDFKLTDFQFAELNKFCELIRRFSDSNDFPELFINTPEWLNVVAEAKKVLEAFNYKKTELS